MAVTAWRDKARLAGYDRMVIHDRDDGDAADVGNFLSVHRNGDMWSRWGFARNGAAIRAWCCLSSADLGEFDSMEAALESVLRGTVVAKISRRKARRPDVPARRDGVVIGLAPHVAACGHPLGSAA